MNIFQKLPGQAYDADESRFVQAHLIKVTNTVGGAKICDIVDLRMAAGHWQDIEREGLSVIGTDGPITDFRSMYWILDGLHRAGSTWDDIKASLVTNETAWI